MMVMLQRSPIVKRYNLIWKRRIWTIVASVLFYCLIGAVAMVNCVVAEVKPEQVAVKVAMPTAVSM